MPYLDRAKRNRASNRHRMRNLARYAEAQRRYQKKHPERVAARVKETRKRNLPARHARMAVYKAIRAGKLVRPDSCSECGKVTKIHAHHPNYAEKFNIIWLCQACHMQRHRKEVS
jgi:hypothetical protein